MVAFKGTLDDQQIWQIIAYLRTEAANLKDKPVFVPDPNNQVIKSEKQTFRIEVVTPGSRRHGASRSSRTDACW